MPGLVQIERGTELISSTPLVIPLATPVADIKNAIITATYRRTIGQSADRSLLITRFIDTQNIEISSGFSAEDSTVEWSVAEFDSGVFVQHIRQTLDGLSVTVDINPIAFFESSIITGGQSSPRSLASWLASEFIRYRLNGPTQAEILRGVAVAGYEVQLQVVDWGGGAATQRGSESVSGVQALDISLTPAVSNALAQGYYSSDFGGTPSILFNTWAGSITTPTTYHVERMSEYTGTQVIEYEVVDFSDAQAQHGMESVLNAQLAAPIALTSIDPDRSIILSGFSSTWNNSQMNSAAGGNNWPGAHGSLEISSATAAEFRRGIGDDIAELGWQLIEFAVSVPGVTGTGALDDAPDAMSGTGTTTAANFASGALADVPDAMAGTVYVSAHYDGAGTLEDLLDNVSGSGIVGAAVAASGSLTDADDTLQGIEIVGHSGQATLDDADDSIAGIGGVISGITASGGLLDASDSASGTITVRHPAAGALSDGQDNIAASGGLDFGALGMLADVPDNLTGFGTIPINVPGDGALTDQADFLRGVGFTQLATDVLGRYFCQELRETVIHDWGGVVTIGGQQARGVLEWGWDEVHDRFVPMLVLESCAHLSLEHGTEVRATLPLIGDKVYWVAGIRPSSGGSTVVMLQEEDPTIPP